MASGKESDVTTSAVSRQEFNKPRNSRSLRRLQHNGQSSATEAVGEEASAQMNPQVATSSAECGEHSRTFVQCSTKTSSRESEGDPRYIPTVSRHETVESLQQPSQQLAVTQCPKKGLPLSPDIRRGDPTGHLQLGSRQWYWKDLDRNSARAKLLGKPEGTFLIRPTSDACHYYAASMVKSGKVYHLLVKHCKGWWSFYNNMKPCKPSVIELVESAIEDSKRGVAMSSVIGPVFLLQPLLKAITVPSLQDQCGLIIQVYTPRHLISKLPLPNRIKKSLINSNRY